MSEKRVTVWVQAFQDRKALMLQWIDPDTGRRKSKSAKTDDPKEAEQARGDLEADLNAGRYAEASRMTWERFRELFEAEYVAGTRQDTQQNYRDTLELFEKVCHPKTLRSINERTISAFAAGMRKTPGRAKGSTGMMASTIKVRLQFLHTALTWAVKQKLLAAVPAFPVVKVPKKDPQPVAMEHFERLFAKAAGDGHMQAYLLCGWLAGLRLSEACELEWEESTEFPWVDFAKSRIILPAEFVKATRDQWVPLDPELRKALEAMPRRGRKVFHFVDHKGERLNKRGVSKRVQFLARRAGVRLTFKSLRRGFGCRYAGKVSAHVLQRLMRHANIAITMTYYANVDAAVEEAVLGPKCNTSRNSGVSEGLDESATDDATDYQGRTN